MELTKGQVNDVVKKEYPNSEVLSHKKTTFGYAHATYFVKLRNPRKEVVLKVCHSRDKLERFKKEELVNELLLKNKIPVPKIIARDFSSSMIKYPYYMREKIEGYNPEFKFKYLSVKVKKDLLMQAGAILARIHNIKFEKTGTFYLKGNKLGVKPTKSWKVFFETIIKSRIHSLRKTQFGTIMKSAENYLDANINLLNKKVFPVFLHGDYKPANILVKENKIQTVLDFECAFVGHNEYGLSKADFLFVETKIWNRRKTDRYSRLLHKGYTKLKNLDEDYWERRKLYRFQNIIEAMETFPAWSKTHPKESKKIVTKVLIDKLNEHINRQ
jgi:aminoglycoside phosphotransferase (APT) family kinase protein